MELFVEKPLLQTNLCIGAFLSLILLLLPSNSEAQVFRARQEEGLINIILFGSLDLYNSKYNDDNISPLTAENLNTLHKDDIFLLDRWMMLDHNKDLDDIGKILLFGSLATTGYFSVYDEPYSWDNLIVLSEILVIQSSIANWTKSLTLRNRPYVYDDSADIDLKTAIRARRSFYSLHTSTVFSLAVYNHYYQNSVPNSNNTVVWMNYLLAGGVAISRIASGEHYLTDVLAGAAAGSLTSYFICTRRGRKSRIRLQSGVNYLGMNVSW